VYSELLIFPSKIAEPERFKTHAASILGAACANAPVDPLVFARDSHGALMQEVFDKDAEGRILSKPPHISISGGKDFFRLTAIGLRGRGVLQEQAALIGTAVGAHLDTPVRYDFREGDCSLEPLFGRMKTYYIPSMVIAKKAKDFERFAPRDRRITLDDVTDKIKQLVVDGLVAQARFLDESYHAAGLPEMADLEGRIPTDDMLNIEVFEGNPSFKSLHAGQKGKALVVGGIALTMALDLQGPWSCGMLRSRGHGRIWGAV